MKIEKFLEDGIHSNMFVVTKSHGKVRTFFMFTILAMLCVSMLGFYHEQQWWLALCSAVVAFAYAVSFYWGADHLILAMPRYAQTMMFFKVDDAYFAGPDLTQAKLFAALHGKSIDQIETIECFSFYKQTKQPET